MASKVFLHIGAPKTGTTFLQQLMAANRDELADQGVLYADGKYPQDRVWATEVLRGHDLSRHPKPHAVGAWERILEQVRAWDGTAVVSHEFLGACSAKQALRAQVDLAPAEVHLVFTARDYLRQGSTVWQERLKYGFSQPLTEFSLDPDNGSPVWSWRTQDVVAILERWRNGIPASSVHVVTVPPPGGSSDVLWERFAAVIGVEPATCVNRMPAINTSLGLAQAELLRRVDERLAPQLPDVRSRATWIRDLLANAVLARAKGERFAVPPDQATELVARADEAVQKLADAGYDVVGSLDDLVPDAASATSRLPEELSSEELLDAAVETISELVLEARTRLDERAAQNRRLRQQAAEERRLRRQAEAVPPATVVVVKPFAKARSAVASIRGRLLRDKGGSSR